MDAISLDEVKLLPFKRRIDIKYVLDYDQFYTLMKMMSNDLLVVTKDGKSLFKYYSIYFDTPDMQMHKDHVEKKLHRQKIRIREYESGEKFLEIKDKNNHMTSKIRVPVTEYEIDGERQWVSDNLMYDTKSLSKKLDTSFTRMTLISKEKDIRMTIDFNLEFFNYISNKTYKFDGIILEIKREDLKKSFVEYTLDSLNMVPQGFSKYNIGLNMTS